MEEKVIHLQGTCDGFMIQCVSLLMTYLAHVSIYFITIAILGRLLTIYITLRGLEYYRYKHSSLSYSILWTPILTP